MHKVVLVSDSLMHVGGHSTTLELTYAVESRKTFTLKNNSEGDEN